MKKKDFTPSRPYLIIGAGDKMTLLVLGSVVINSDSSNIPLGSRVPIRENPKQYAYESQKTGKITIYEVSEGIEEIHIEDAKGLSVYRYFEDTNSLAQLFDNITSIEDVDEGRLIKKDEVYYLNSLEEDDKLGIKLTDNLYLNNNDDFEMKDEFIIGDSSLLFGRSGCCLSLLNGSFAHKIKGNSYLANDDYWFIRLKDLTFIIFLKDGEPVLDPFVTTTFFGCPAEFTRVVSQNVYVMTGLGDIENIYYFELQPEKQSKFPPRIYGFYKEGFEINVAGSNKKETFYYLPESKTVSEITKVNDNVEVYQNKEDYHVMIKS